MATPLGSAKRAFAYGSKHGESLIRRSVVVNENGAERAGEQGIPVG